MIRTIAAALAALALTSFGVLADDAPKADAPGAEKKMDKPKKAHKKGKKAKKAAETKPADAAPAK